MDLRQVQTILGHTSILTTAKYTRLTEDTSHNASERINALMDRFTIIWGDVQ